MITDYIDFVDSTSVNSKASYGYIFNIRFHIRIVSLFLRTHMLLPVFNP